MSFQSTHPLRGATRHGESLRQRHGISIHAPLAGCDGRRRLPGNCWIIISIHAPLAGCDSALRSPARRAAISIHAPLAGCDRAWLDGQATYRFQSTHPLRGATRSARRVCLPHNISIHAPLAGCDSWMSFMARFCPHFNPRTPCGVRPRRAGCAHRPADYFNPRTPCGVRRCNF